MAWDDDVSNLFFFSSSVRSIAMMCEPPGRSRRGVTRRGPPPFTVPISSLFFPPALLYPLRSKLRRPHLRHFCASAMSQEVTLAQLTKKSKRCSGLHVIYNRDGFCLSVPCLFLSATGCTLIKQSYIVKKNLNHDDRLAMHEIYVKCSCVIGFNLAGVLLH